MQIEGGSCPCSLSLITKFEEPRTRREEPRTRQNRTRREESRITKFELPNTSREELNNENRKLKSLLSLRLQNGANGELSPSLLEGADGELMLSPSLLGGANGEWTGRALCSGLILFKLNLKSRSDYAGE